MFIYRLASSGLDKRLVAVRQRIQKHLATSSPQLVGAAWTELESTCLKQWNTLEQQLKRVFRVVVTPSSEEMQALFKAAAA